MNLQEAIKSGRPFRRPCWTHADWIVVHKFPHELAAYGGGELKLQLSRTTYPLMFLNDLLADDWIIKEEPKPKVIRWLWAVLDMSRAEKMFFQATNFYTAEEVEHDFPDREKFKLEWSRQEFDT